jgi:hypothetical protein
MKIGQKVVFVREVKGAGVGKRGIVMRVSNDTVVVDCKLHEDQELAPVPAQMWDLLPERLWERIPKPGSGKKTMDALPR